LSIHSDQLCGHWFLKLCEDDDSNIFPTAKVETALDTMYSKNVKCLKDGKMGAANGMMPDGSIDTFTIQSEETWTGVTYALASTMIAHVSFIGWNSSIRGSAEHFYCCFGSALG